MDKISSFKVDHRRLNRGIFVSRLDNFEDCQITTFDIRICRPYEDAVMSASAIHTIEHLGATFMRTMSSVDKKVIYFGPMGCQTGFYLILHGKHTSPEVWNAVKEMFKYIANYEGHIPGATEKECGNCYLNDLSEARRVAFKFFNEVLSCPTVKNQVYPV